MRDASGYVTACRIAVDARLTSTLTKLWSYSAPEIWTALEFGGTTRNRTIAVLCAIRGGERPGPKRHCRVSRRCAHGTGPPSTPCTRCRSIGWTPRPAQLHQAG